MLDLNRDQDELALGLGTQVLAADLGLPRFDALDDELEIAIADGRSDTGRLWRRNDGFRLGNRHIDRRSIGRWHHRVGQAGTG